MEENPLKQILAYEKPKSKLLETSKLAAEAIQDAVKSLTLKHPGKPTLMDYFLATINSLQQSLKMVADNQALNESLIFD